MTKTNVISITIISFVLLLLSCCSKSGSSSDWAMFRGNLQRTGVYKTEALQQFNGIKWKFRTDYHYRDTSPVVCGNVVYFGGGDSLYAIECKTGKEIWRYDADDEICSSPIVSNSIVYFGSRYYLHAVYSKTGKKKWKFKAGNYIESSPAIVGNIGLIDKKWLLF